MNPIYFNKKAEGLAGLELLSERVSDYTFYKDILERCDWKLIPPFIQKTVNKYAGEQALSDIWDSGDNKAISKQLRGVRAICWEFDCIQYAQKHNFKLDVSATFIKKDSLRRRAYAKTDSFNVVPDYMEDRLYMQNDVPIISNSEFKKPIWIEAKSSWFSSYGTPYGRYANSGQHLNVSSLNQLLRYQAAIDEGLIETATVVIDGRIHPNMWSWIKNGPDGNGSLVSGVEFLWALPIPHSHPTDSTLVKIKDGVGESFWKVDERLSSHQKKFVDNFLKKAESSPEWLSEMLQANLTVMEVMEAYYQKRQSELPKPHPMSFKPWMVSYTDVESIYVNALRQFVIESVHEPLLKKELKKSLTMK